VALGVALDQIQRADQRAVGHLAGVEVDQRHVERLLDADHLGAGSRFRWRTSSIRQAISSRLSFVSISAKRIGRLLVSSFQYPSKYA
jgi:hypothetical protein